MKRVRMCHVVAVALAVNVWGVGSARADLCNSVQGGAGTKPNQVTGLEMSLYRDLFKDGALQGNDTWNQVVVQCNRQRDTKGNEVAAVTQTHGGNAGKTQLRALDLEPKIIRGHYNFFGTIVTQQKYVYLLSKSAGKWTMIIPYKAQIQQLNGGSIDLGMGQRWLDSSGKLGATQGDGHAWRLYEASQVKTSGGVISLVSGARPVAETMCNTTTFFPGHEHDYDGQSGINSYKRDRENKRIQLGKIQFRYGHDKTDAVFEGCRVPEYTKLYWAVPSPAGSTSSTSGTTTLATATAKEFVLQNFEQVAESYWSIPGVFTLKLLLRGRNDDDFSKAALAPLLDGDYLTANFATQFQTNGREMYKSNPIEFNNFSTMTEDATFQHEVGHAFGLDDEYGKQGKLNDCGNKSYAGFSPSSYKMCDSEATEQRSIYHYLAVSRYVTRQSECQADSDCPNHEYCDDGVDLTKNACHALKDDGAPCALVGGGHQCKSGQCGMGRCYTTGSQRIGGTCYIDAACTTSHCSSVDGLGGTCVCRVDNDCSPGQWCNAGVDVTKNACEPLKADGASCDLVGGSHQCKGGACKFSKCYTPGSVPIGSSCFVDDACKQGKCSSVDGFGGTCVCNSDQDCGPGNWCDAGFDTHLNACHAKLPSGASCGSAVSAGNDHKCKSGECSGFPNYKCK